MPLALLYHAVFPIPPQVPAADRTLVVEPGELAWQLGELARRGFRTLTLDEYHEAVERGDDDPSNVLLTFDDAYAHVIRTVTPLLGAHGMTAALFASPGHDGAVNDWDASPLPVHGLPLATADELRRAAASGSWELGAHGLRHVDLRTLEPEQRLRELSEARSALSELAGRAVVDLAYPFGAADESVRDDARRAGYRMAFLAGGNGVCDRFGLPRLAIRGQEGRRAFAVKVDSVLRRLFD